MLLSHLKFSRRAFYTTVSSLSVLTLGKYDFKFRLNLGGKGNGKAIRGTRWYGMGCGGGSGVRGEEFGERGRERKEIEFLGIPSSTLRFLGKTWHSDLVFLPPPHLPLPIFVFFDREKVNLCTWRNGCIYNLW